MYKISYEDAMAIVFLWQKYLEDPKQILDTDYGDGVRYQADKLLSKIIYILSKKYNLPADEFISLFAREANMRAEEEIQKTTPKILE